MQYGPIVDIDLKLPPRPPGYAFIEVSSNRTNFWYLQSCINVQLWTSILIYFEWTFLFWLIQFIKTVILQYEDSRDAEDAIYYRDGYNFDGYRLRVSDTQPIYLYFYF